MRIPIDFKTCLQRALLAAFATIWAASAQAQLLLDGGINPEDDRLYAWYDAAEFLGADGDPSTPIWPNSQGEESRAIANGFSPSGGFDVLELDNGLPIIEFTDMVTWANVDQFGIVESEFTIFVTAIVRDPFNAWFFTGNQGGGGTEANAGFGGAAPETWSLKSSDNLRFDTAPVDVDELQYHAFTFNEDGIASHHINGELKGQDEIGYASLEGLVLGGRQNGGQRGTGLEFAEILIYDVALSDDDRQTIEGFFQRKYFGGGGLLGDFNDDGFLTEIDINLLSEAVRDGSQDSLFDVDASGTVDQADRTVWVNDLKKTYFGDSNLDGEFNSSDFVLVFTAGTYEDDVEGNGLWENGDWNGDGDFGSSDFVTAFQAGGYELGPRTAVAAVPEPSSILLITLAAMIGLAVRRK